MSRCGKYNALYNTIRFLYYRAAPCLIRNVFSSPMQGQAVQAGDVPQTGAEPARQAAHQRHAALRGDQRQEVQ